MSQSIKKGDKITLVAYTVPTIGHPFKSEIRINPDVAVTKSGKVSYSVETRMGERRFKHDDIGKPVEGHFRGSYVVSVTPEIDLDRVIEKAKKSIIDALSSRIRFYQELVTSHQAEFDKDIPVIIRQQDD